MTDPSSCSGERVRGRPEVGDQVQGGDESSTRASRGIGGWGLTLEVDAPGHVVTVEVVAVVVAVTVVVATPTTPPPGH